MMKNVLFPEMSKRAMVIWSDPIPYDDFVNGIIDFPESDPYEVACQAEDDNFWVLPSGKNNPNFYMILGNWGTKKKLFYIGKTTKSILARTKQADHTKRRRKMHEDFSKHKLMISKGHYFMGVVSGYRSNKTDYRIDEIESLLIYANEPRYNVSKKWNNNVSSDYWIRNCGYYEPLYKEIYYGLMGKR